MSWLSWDGRRLRFGAEAGASIELRLDGAVFERIAVTERVIEREFATAPSGNAQMLFALHAADGRALAPPWRVLHAQPAVPGHDAWNGAAAALRPLADAPLPPRTPGAPEIAIVVPIYNASDLAQRCIEAVLRWTDPRVHLILIDDASTDAAVAPLLTRYAPRARSVRNTHNLGYTRSCNIGIELAGRADVVLLNSDTEVGPRWLERLLLTAHADTAIGTVTAVSDNAGAFSVPELEQYCPLPAGWTLVQAQRALLQNAGGCLPELPTGNGFCMYIKRALLDRVGVLDADAFPAGYGEENDLCQRAEHAGFRHVIAGDVLVRHARSASFGLERRQSLGAQGMAILRARYPDYETKVGATLFSFARRVLDYRVRRIWSEMPAPFPRVLLADAGGAAVPGLECFILDEQNTAWRLSRDGSELDTAPRADSAALCRWLVRHAIEAVIAARPHAELQAAALRVCVPVCANGDEAALVARGASLP